MNLFLFNAKPKVTNQLLLILLIFSQSDISAQLRDVSYSISVEPTLSNRLMTFKGNQSQSYKDSIQKIDRGRDAIGAAFMVSFQTSKKRRLYTGIQFHNFGFTRKIDDIKFQDTIHPQIGVMNDLSQTGGAYAEFNHRFMYVSVPLLFSYQLSGKKMPNTVIHLIYGASASILLKHDIRAVLRGFSSRGGEKVHVLTNEEAEPERINVNFHGGFRFENSLYGKNTWVFVQPELFIPTLNANRSSERARLWAIGIQVGIYFKPNKDKTKL